MEEYYVLGGDPLYYENRDEVIELIHFIKENTDKNIYLWTGYLKEEVEKWIDASLIDYLIDGKFEIGKKDLRLKLEAHLIKEYFIMEYYEYLNIIRGC